jgi:hypothetical protein
MHHHAEQAAKLTALNFSGGKVRIQRRYSRRRGSDTARPSNNPNPPRKGTTGNETGLRLCLILGAHDDPDRQ